MSSKVSVFPATGVFGTLGLARAFWALPMVSIVVPFFGSTNFILRILNGSPKKELQWRL